MQENQSKRLMINHYNSRKIDTGNELKKNIEKLRTQK